MGKIIAGKISGMNLWAKVALITLCTLLVSVFMYEGWYKPLSVQAATVTYQPVVPDQSTAVGIDGTCNLASGQPTTAPTVRTTMSTTYTASASSYRPTTGMTQGSPTILMKIYGPQYAATQNITAPAGTFAVRGYNASDTWTFHLYEYDPAAAAGNKRLIYQSNTITSGSAATEAVVPTYTAQANTTIQSGHRLMCEVVYTPGGGTLTPRVYLDGTSSTAWSRLTVTETTVSSPSVTINQASGQADPTSTSPINFTVIFSQSVTDFTTGDVTISGTAGGTKTATVTGSGTTYNVAVTGMTTSGTVIASIPAGVASGNTASTSTDANVTWNAPDTTSPSVTINQAAGQADPTGTAPINFTVVFSEPTTNFATGDVTISGTAGGTKTATVSGSGTTYNVAVSGMTTAGTVIANIAAGVATDAAGNGNTVATSTDNSVNWTVASCTTGPQTLTIAPSAANVLPGGNVVYTVTVSNGDSGTCTARPYTLTRGTPSNSVDFVTSALSKTALSVPAGGTDFATFTVNANAGAANGVANTVAVSTTGTTPTSVSSTTTVSTFSSPLMHNATNTGSTKSGGAWGNDKDCTWCHNAVTNNIKQIANTITPPWSATARPVVFDRITSSVTTALGTMGNDARSALNRSTNVCEVCHTQTKFHQYSANSTTTPQTALDHYNNQDCAKCHAHKDGFKGNGHLFPYAGSAHRAVAGLAPWSDCNTCHNTSSTAAKTYPVAAGVKVNCVGCHINGLRTPVGTSSCWDCHGVSATNGWPNGAAFPNTDGSHSRHSGLTAITCDNCHSGYGAGTPTHGFSNRAVTTEAYMALANGTWNSAAGTCATSNCHGALSPAWGSNTTAHLCTKCHGTPTTATSVTNAQMAPATGAHQVHVRGTGTNSYSRILTCYECHNSNNGTSVNFTGHMNGTGTVLFTNASTALKNGVNGATAWGGAASKTCSLYCHGASMPYGDVSGTNRTPVWTNNAMSGNQATDCALCHGFPPTTTTTHNAFIGQPNSCTTCHKHFPANNIFTTEANRRLHIDGIVQVDADCNGCHDYDTVGATQVAGVWSGGTWGKNSKDGLTPNQGFGSHAKHINYIKTRLGYTVALNGASQTYGAAGSDGVKVCGTCHSNVPAAHTIDNSSARDIFPAAGPFLMGGTGGTSLLFGTVNPSYNTTAKTCSNISCHYFTTPKW